MPKCALEKGLAESASAISFIKGFARQPWQNMGKVDSSCNDFPCIKPFPLVRATRRIHIPQQGQFLPALGDTDVETFRGASQRWWSSCLGRTDLDSNSSCSFF
jgi:hypothetical protein